MSVLSGFLKLKRHVLKNDGYHLVSEWTSSSTVEMNNGKTLEEEFKNVRCVELTQAQYDALGSEKLTNNVNYFIKDAN